MTRIRTLGGYAGFYMAAAYALGIVVFLVVLDYPSMTDPAQKVGLLATSGGMVWASNLLLYIGFAAVLSIFALALRDLFVAATPNLARLGFATGVIWAGLLMASGMIANAAMGPITALYASDPDAAIALWSATDAVTNGMGGGAGEVAGGLMTLIFSLAGLRSTLFSAALAYLGLLVGAIGLVAALPGLGELGGVFGITQIIWFIWTGVVLLRA